MNAAPSISASIAPGWDRLVFVANDVRISRVDRLCPLQSFGQLQPSVSGAKEHFIPFRLALCIRQHLLGEQLARLGTTHFAVVLNCKIKF